MTSQNHCITISLLLRTTVSWSYHTVGFPVFPTHNVNWLNTNMHVLLYPESFCVFSDHTEWIDAPLVGSRIATLVAWPYRSSLLQYGKQGGILSAEGTSCHTVPWYLDSASYLSVPTAYNCFCLLCVPHQYSQPVRVQPWHSRKVLPRRTLALQRCTLTSSWVRCLRRTLRMRTKGRGTCSWMRRRIGPCHHRLGARTAPMKWVLITLMEPCII